MEKYLQQAKHFHEQQTVDTETIKEHVFKALADLKHPNKRSRKKTIAAVITGALIVLPAAGFAAHQLMWDGMKIDVSGYKAPEPQRFVGTNRTTFNNLFQYTHNPLSLEHSRKIAICPIREAKSIDQWTLMNGVGIPSSGPSGVKIDIPVLYFSLYTNQQEQTILVEQHLDPDPNKGTLVLANGDEIIKGFGDNLAIVTINKSKSGQEWISLDIHHKEVNGIITDMMFSGDVGVPLSSIESFAHAFLKLKD